MTKNYVVEGMTCDHCTSAVTQEISQVEGTQGVDIDLATGNVAVTGEGFSDESIAAAVAEAGYLVRL
ncbi:heavy-metal-associated domain-containing protein [Corynebacterium sp. A21]|uniref:heavy-metal-associated domain-containing protein n=1 Tax=Corynebacterium sp. A21 TaxID=3457318 RepID=UPI003FD031E9